MRGERLVGSRQRLTAIFLSAVFACSADAEIYRWDNEWIIPGTEDLAGEPGAQLDRLGLAYAELDEKDLTGATFAFSDVSYAWLTSSRLTDVDLRGAVVRGTDFADTTSRGFTKDQLYSTASYAAKDLRDVRLDRNDLSGWDFSGQRVFGASFHSTTLAKEQLYSTASYQAKDLSRIGLRRNDLRGWDFSGQNLSHVMFDYAQLANADFTGAALTGASFSDTTSRGFTKEQLYSTASYQQKDLSQVRLDGFNDLRGWDFRGQDLTNANFDFSLLTNADFTDAVVTGTIFHRTTSADPSRSFSKEQLYSTASYRQKNLTGIGLRAVDLSGWDFSGQNLTGANLFDSKLTHADFNGAIVRDAQLTGITKEQLYSTASYRAKDLREIGISGDLSGWDLSGQDLSHATLLDVGNANIRGAVVTFASLGDITKEQLYSTASYAAKDLRGIALGRDVSGWDFREQDLTGARLQLATLTNADFRGAWVKGVNFGEATPGSLVKEQIYSTASYAAKDLTGIGLDDADLSGWDLSDQNLAHASVRGAKLTNTNLRGASLVNADMIFVENTGADLSFADLRGADTTPMRNAVMRNVILPEGEIAALELLADDVLLVRNYRGDASRNIGPIPITVQAAMTMSGGSVLQLQFDAQPWESQISFEPGVSVQLGGTLELTFADDVDVAAQVGRTIQVFDWTDVEPFGEFAVSSPYAWDTRELYTAGAVTLAAVPEPPSWRLGLIAIVLLALWRMRPPVTIPVGVSPHQTT
jgi:uncharacterized protein YjbI with pentapeptide repeats